MKLLGAFLITCVMALQAEAAIQVMAATYGGNCGARGGNATSDVRNECNGREQCNYLVDVFRLGDPCYKTEKDFTVDYTCDGRTRQQAIVNREANGRTAFLECRGGYNPPPPPPNYGGQIRINSATYGGNVRGVRPNNAYNAVQRDCDGRQACNFVVSVSRLGDPAYKQEKDFRVTYDCGGRGSQRSAYIPPEANGRSVLLSCR